MVLPDVLEPGLKPEDVGSPSGYMEYLEALKDPSHPDRQQMVEWRGPSFDPGRFNPSGINRRLSRLSRSRRRTWVLGYPMGTR